MAKYAQIKDGKVINFVEIEDPSKEGSYSVGIDILFNLDAIPNNNPDIGWEYNQSTGEFIKPEIPIIKLSRSAIRSGCCYIIDYIAEYNDKHFDDSDLQNLISQPWFGQITILLLSGAPATARILISQYGQTLYPQEIVDQVLAKLDVLK